MTTERLVLTIDLGTGGPKAAIVSEDGTLVATALRAVGTSRIGERGAEQDPTELWNAVLSCVREVLSQAGTRRQFVCGIVCISQYSSIVPVDPSGVPTHNMLLWMDGRGAPYGTALYREDSKAIPKWVERHGAIPLPSGADSLSHMLFIKNERPQAYERTRFFLEPMDFLNLRFTGEGTANLGSAYMMLLTNNHDPECPVWDPELVALSGIEAEKLPALVPMRGPIGTVRPQIAEELGLPPHVRVYSSMNDTQAAAIATGAFMPARGGLNIGTTCQVLSHMERKATDFESHLVSVPSPVRGKYLILAENGLGGGALRHLIEGVLFSRGALGDATHEHPYAHLDRSLEGTPPGAGGVLFLPWLAGALFPDDDPFMRGGFLNVSLDTTREHLVRAAMEGVALNLCAMIEPVERFAGGGGFEELAFCGGGALSAQWTQILADVSQRPVAKLANPRFVNNLAGALVAFDDMGVRDLASVYDFVRVESTCAPRPENRDLYRRLAEHQRDAFQRLRSLFRTMNG